MTQHQVVGQGEGAAAGALAEQWFRQPGGRRGGVPPWHLHGGRLLPRAWPAPVSASQGSAGAAPGSAAAAGGLGGYLAEQDICSEAWRRHVAAMEQPDACSEEVVPACLEALALANLLQLNNLEAQAARGEATVPCPNGTRCLGVVERCLRPVVVRRGLEPRLATWRRTTTMSASSATALLGEDATTRCPCWR